MPNSGYMRAKTGNFPVGTLICLNRLIILIGSNRRWEFIHSKLYQGRLPFIELIKSKYYLEKNLENSKSQFLGRYNKNE